VTCLVITTFLWQNIAWADPALSIRNKATLAPYTLFTIHNKAESFQKFAFTYINNQIFTSPDKATLHTVKNLFLYIKKEALRRGLAKEHMPKIVDGATLDGAVKIIFSNGKSLLFYNPRSVYDMAYTPKDWQKYFDPEEETPADIEINKYLREQILERKTPVSQEEVSPEEKPEERTDKSPGIEKKPPIKIERKPTNTLLTAERIVRVISVGLLTALVLNYLLNNLTMPASNWLMIAGAVVSFGVAMIARLDVFYELRSAIERYVDNKPTRLADPSIIEELFEHIRMLNRQRGFPISPSNLKHTFVSTLRFIFGDNALSGRISQETGVPDKLTISDEWFRNKGILRFVQGEEKPKKQQKEIREKLTITNTVQKNPEGAELIVCALEAIGASDEVVKAYRRVNVDGSTYKKTAEEMAVDDKELRKRVREALKRLLLYEEKLQAAKDGECTKEDMAEYIKSGVQKTPLKEDPQEALFKLLESDKYVDFIGKEFGRRLEAALEEKGIRREEAAERTGLTRGAIDRWIGGRLPDVKNCKVLVVNGLRDSKITECYLLTGMSFSKFMAVSIEDKESYQYKRLIGLKLKVLRYRKALTLSAISAKIKGMRVSELSDCEKGLKLLSEEKLQKAARILGSSLKKLEGKAKTIGEQSSKGGLIGRLYYKDSAGKMYRETGSVEPEERETETGEKYLVFFGHDKWGKKYPLYTEKDMPAVAWIMDPREEGYPENITMGIRLKVLRDNNFVWGCAGERARYATLSFLKGINSELVRYHERKEMQYAIYMSKEAKRLRKVRSEDRYKALNPHTFERGCGKDIRRILWERERQIKDGEIVGDKAKPFANAESVISFLETVPYRNINKDKLTPSQRNLKKLYKRGATEAEKALIRYNWDLGRRGEQITWGGQDWEFASYIEKEDGSKVLVGSFVNESLDWTWLSSLIFETIIGYAPKNWKELSRWMDPDSDRFGYLFPALRYFPSRAQQLINQKYGGVELVRRKLGFPPVNYRSDQRKFHLLGGKDCPKLYIELVDLYDKYGSYVEVWNRLSELSEASQKAIGAEKREARKEIREAKRLFREISKARRTYGKKSEQQKQEKRIPKKRKEFGYETETARHFLKQSKKFLEKNDFNKAYEYAKLALERAHDHEEEAKTNFLIRILLGGRRRILPIAEELYGKRYYAELNLFNKAYSELGYQLSGKIRTLITAAYGERRILERLSKQYGRPPERNGIYYTEEEFYEALEKEMTGDIEPTMLDIVEVEENIIKGRKKTEAKKQALNRLNYMIEKDVAALKEAILAYVAEEENLIERIKKRNLLIEFAETERGSALISLYEIDRAIREADKRRRAQYRTAENTKKEEKPKEKKSVKEKDEEPLDLDEYPDEEEHDLFDMSEGWAGESDMDSDQGISDDEITGEMDEYADLDDLAGDLDVEEPDEDGWRTLDQRFEWGEDLRNIGIDVILPEDDEYPDGGGMIPLVREWLGEKNARKHQAWIEQVIFWGLTIALSFIPGVGVASGVIAWSAFYALHYLPAKHAPPAPRLFYRPLIIITLMNAITMAAILASPFSLSTVLTDSQTFYSTLGITSILLHLTGLVLTTIVHHLENAKEINKNLQKITSRTGKDLRPSNVLGWLIDGINSYIESIFTRHLVFEGAGGVQVHPVVYMTGHTDGRAPEEPMPPKETTATPATEEQAKKTLDLLIGGCIAAFKAKSDLTVPGDENKFDAEGQKKISAAFSEDISALICDLIANEVVDDGINLMEYAMKKLQKQLDQMGMPKKLFATILYSLYAFIGSTIACMSDKEHLASKKDAVLKTAAHLAEFSMEIVAINHPNSLAALPHIAEILADIYQRQERYEELASISKKYIILFYKNPAAQLTWLMHLAMAFFRQEEWEKYRFINELLLKHPNLPIANEIKFTILKSWGYTTGLFPWKNGVQEELKPELEKCLRELDKIIAAGEDEMAKDPLLRGAILYELAMSYIMTETNYEKALEIAEELLAKDPNDVRNFKLYMLVLTEQIRNRLKEDQKSEALKIITKVEKVLTAKKRELDLVEEMPEEIKKVWLSLIEYYYASFSYLKGDAVKAEEGYRKLYEENSGEMIVQTVFSYVHTLIDLSRKEEAKSVMLRGFEELGTLKEEGFQAESVMVQAANFDPLDGIEVTKELAHEVLSDIKQWKGISPKGLYQMALGALAFDGKSAGIVQQNLLNLIEEEGLKEDDVPHFLAIVSAYLTKIGRPTREFLRRVIYECKDPAVKQLLTDYLRTEACKYVWDLNDIGLFALISQSDGSPATPLGRILFEKRDDSVHACFVRGEDDPFRFFKELESSEKYPLFTEKDDADILDVLVYPLAADVMKQYLFLLPEDSEEQREFKENLRRFFTSKNITKYNEKFQEVAARNERLCVTLYNNLAQLASIIGNDERAIRFYSDMMKTGKEDIARKSPHALSAFIGYILVLKDKGEEEEAEKILNIWINSINILTSRAEQGKPFTEGYDEVRLYEEIFNSIVTMPISMLIKLCVTNEKAAKAVKKTIDKRIDNLGEDPSFNAAGNLAELACVINHTEGLAKAIVPLAKATHKTKKNRMHFVFLLQKLIYRHLTIDDHSCAPGGFSLEELYAIAEEMLAEQEEGTWLTQARANFHIFKGEYTEAITLLEEALKKLTESDEAQSETFDILLTLIMLTSAYKLDGKDEQALSVLREGIEREAKRPDDGSKKSPTFVEAPFIRWVPEQFQDIIVKMLVELLLDRKEKALSQKAAYSVFRALDALVTPEVIPVLIEHLKSIINGEKEFDETKEPEANIDIKIIEWAYNLPTQYKVIIDLFVTDIKEIVGGKKAKNRLPKLKKHIDAIQQRASSKFTPEEYNFAAEYLIGKRQYEDAIKLVDRALSRLRNSKKSSKEKQDFTAKLNIQREKAQKAVGLLQDIKKNYNDDRFDQAQEACQRLLEINPNDEFAHATKLVISILEEAKKLIDEGRVEEAYEILGKADNAESVPKIDKKLSKVNNLVVTRSKVAKYLENGEYNAARERLNKAANSGDHPLGVVISEGHPALSPLYEKLKAIEDKVNSRIQIIKRKGASLKDIYEQAQALLKYPEKETKDLVFETILRKAIEEFNIAQDEKDPDLIKRQYAYVLNIARLVYELRDYEPEMKYMEKAQKIISHAVANIWLPDLIDAYFMLYAMHVAEENRDKRQKKQIKTDIIAFAFSNFYVTHKGIVVTGFSDPKSGSPIDIRKYALHGDTFKITPFKEGEDELQPFFRVRSVENDRLSFELPRVREGYDELIQRWKTALDEGGTIARAKNDVWKNQCDMLREIIMSLKKSTHMELPLEGTFARATAMKSARDEKGKVIDYALGILLDIPEKKKLSEITQKRKAIEHIVKGLERSLGAGYSLDPEQREAILDGLNEGMFTSFIQGPGGTGKSTVIVHLAELITEELGSSVVLASQTHAGVDAVVEKELNKNGFIVRVGNNEDAIDDPDIYALWARKTELLSEVLAGKKRHFIAATINGFFTDRDINPQEKLKCADYLIVDESSRATIAESLWAVYMLNGLTKVIFVGDQAQLPAYGLDDDDARFAIDELTNHANCFTLGDFGERRSVKDEIFTIKKRAEFRISMLEKVLDLFENDIFKVTRPNFHMLEVQRRSGFLIVKMDNYFYDGKLIAGKEDSGVVIEDNYKGKYPEEKEGMELENTINRGEINRVISWVNWLINHEKITKTEELGIISPYNKQVERITEALLDFSELHEYLTAVEKSARADMPDNIKRLLTQSEYVLFRVNDLYSAGGVSDCYRLRDNFIKHPRPETARALRERLQLGDNFMSLADLERGKYFIKTIDKAIGNERRAIIFSWVRSNRWGNAGFLSDSTDEKDGLRRRNVAVARPQEYAIHIWDRKTFEKSKDHEICRWAAHNIEVFEEAKALHGKVVLNKNGEVTTEDYKGSVKVKPEERRSAGHVGKYKAAEEKEPQYAPETNTLTGTLVNWEDETKIIDLSKAADLDRAPPEEIREALETLDKDTNNDIVSEIINRYLLNFKGNTITFDHPDDPVLCFAMRDLIGISKNLLAIPVLLFHEIAHAIIDMDGGDGLLEKIESYLKEKAPEKLELMLAKAGENAEKQIRAHYVLRAFQWEVFGPRDKELTDMIKELKKLKEARLAAETESKEYPALGTAEEIINNVDKIVPLVTNALRNWAEGKSEQDEEVVLLLDLPAPASDRIKKLIDDCVIKPLKRMQGNNGNMARVLKNLIIADSDDKAKIKARIEESGRLKSENVIVLTSKTNINDFEKFENSFITALDLSDLDEAKGFDPEAYYYPYVEAVFFTLVRALGTIDESERSKDELIKEYRTRLWGWYRQIPNVKEMTEEELIAMCIENGNPRKIVTLKLVIPDAEKFDPVDIYILTKEFITKA